MKIRLLSDIHAEFYKAYGGFNKMHILQSQGEDVLVLAGDIGVGADQVASTLQAFIGGGAKHIVYVTGNHEYYRSTHQDLEQNLELALDSMPQVHWLRGGSVVELDGVYFMGATLWTNFDEDPVAETLSGRCISDFRAINGFSTKLCKELFYADLEGLQQQYVSLDPDAKKVVVTHFLPSPLATHPKYRSTNDPVNKYFANDLDHWIEMLHNTTWLFGHTHEAMQFKLHNTDFYCNPLGYPGEQQTNPFNSKLIINI